MAIAHVKSRLPWIGSTIKFGKNPDTFIADSQQKYGDTFSATLAGKRKVFITNGHDFAEVFRQAKKLSAENSNPEIGSLIFGFDAKRYLGVQHELEKITKKHMQGQALEPLGIKMQAELETSLLNIASHKNNKDLTEFMYETLFPAGSKALFGAAAESADMLKHFLNLDKPLPLVLAGVPTKLMPSFTKAQKYFAQWMSQAQSDQSEVLDERHKVWEREATDAFQRGSIDASILWAAQANTIPSAIWAIYYVSKNAKIAALVKDELQQVISKAEADPNCQRSPNGFPVLTTAMLDEMEILDSCIWETLRLTTSTIITREALAPVSVNLHDGSTLDLDFGEQVLLYTRAMHLDEETYTDAHEFRHDRFIKSQAVKYNKNGETLKYPLLPFGGGQSRCPGMFFAINEFKILLALLFQWFDFEIVNQSPAQLDYSRTGLGSMPPKKAIKIHYKRREFNPHTTTVNIEMAASITQENTKGCPFTL